MSPAVSASAASMPTNGWGTTIPMTNGWGTGIPMTEGWGTAIP
jgi:hypothetical protein